MEQANSKERGPGGVVKMTLKNYGQTPAINVKIASKVWIDSSGQLTDVPDSEFEFGGGNIYPGGVASKSTVDPGAELPNRFFSDRLKLDRDRDFLINNRVFVISLIFYEDIFGNKYRREYCFLCMQPGPDTVRFGGTDKHNTEIELK